MAKSVPGNKDCGVVTASNAGYSLVEIVAFGMNEESSMASANHSHRLQGALTLIDCNLI
jgi:hypothetical protein